MKNIFSYQKSGILIKTLFLICVFSISGCDESEKSEKQSSTVDTQNLKQPWEDTLSDTNPILKKSTKPNLTDRPAHNIEPNPFPDKQPSTVDIQNLKQPWEDTLSDTKPILKKTTKPNLTENPSHNIESSPFPDGPILIPANRNLEAEAEEEEGLRQQDELYNRSAFAGGRWEERGASEADSIQPLAKKTGRESFCGVESYRSIRRSVCGVELYKNDRSKHCGVERYKEGQSSSCPDSYPEDAYWSRESTRSYPVCNHGYQRERRSSREIPCRGADPDRCGGGSLYKSYCVKPAFNGTCRLEEFGVDLYKECRNSHHGPERYNACRKPEFGVDKYKQCSFYLKPAEITQYINGKKQIIGFMGEILINQKGLFYAFGEDEVGMACTIKRYEPEPLFDPVTIDLKGIFAAKFGKEYKATDYDCNSTDAIQDIANFSCPTGAEDTRICKAQLSYKATKKWFSVTRKDIINLLSDIPATQTASIKASLKAIQGKLNKVKIEP